MKKFLMMTVAASTIIASSATDYIDNFNKLCNSVENVTVTKIAIVMGDLTQEVNAQRLQNIVGKLDKFDKEALADALKSGHTDLVSFVEKSLASAGETATETPAPAGETATETPAPAEETATETPAPEGETTTETSTEETPAPAEETAAETSAPAEETATETSTEETPAPEGETSTEATA